MMDPITIGVLGVCVMVALLLCGMPVGLTMGLAGYGGLLVLASPMAAHNLVATIPFRIISDYNFCVLPLFVLMANVCFYTQFGRNLFDLTYKWLGRLPGGLAAATIGSCAMFGAVCASILATSLTIGLVAIPEMKRYKYDATLAASCVASGGILGILIPPSSVFIIYGIMTEQSIGELFIAGIGPGIVLAIMFIIMVMIRVKLNPALAPAGPKFSMKEKMMSLLQCAEMFALIALSIGGLIVGWFTPTEAGGIGSLGAIVLSLIRKRLTWEAFKKACVETVLSSAMIYLMLIGALVFNAFLTMSTLPMELATLVSGFNLPPFAVIALIILVYLILGCLIDAMAMILLTIPAFYPVVTSLGYDPIWFGVIIVMVMGMATITPPVGMNVYVIAGIAPDVSMGKLFRGIVPYVVVELLFILLLIVFPQIALWLPKLVVH
jgi:tripartite ATP-independent transporter DctM subunit